MPRSAAARRMRVDGHRPEPAQTVGTAAGLVDAADAVLVDRGAEIRRAELEGLLIHRKPCDFCHAAEFLRASLSAELIFWSLS